jgi:hypothetical protein
MKHHEAHTPHMDRSDRVLVHVIVLGLMATVLVGLLWKDQKIPGDVAHPGRRR